MAIIDTIESQDRIEGLEAIWKDPQHLSSTSAIFQAFSIQRHALE